MFNAVVVVGVKIFTVGVFFYACGFVAPQPHAGGISNSIGSLLQGTGLITISTVPISQFSMGDFMWGHKKSAAVTTCGLYAALAMPILFHYEKLGVLVVSLLGAAILLHYPVLRLIVSRSKQLGF